MREIFKWSALLLVLIMFLGSCAGTESEVQMPTTMGQGIDTELAAGNENHNKLRYSLQGKDLVLYDGEIRYSCIYEYDEEGRVSKENIRYSNTISNESTEIILEFFYSDNVIERIICYQDGMEKDRDEQNGQTGMLYCECAIEDYRLSFEYFEDGKLYEESVYLPNGECWYSVIYMYDADGNIVNHDICYLNWKHPGHATTVWTKREYVYDTEGNRIAMYYRQHNYGDDKEYATDLINFLTENTLVAAVAQFDSDDNISGYTVYNYNFDGKLLEEIYYDMENDEIGSMTYTYSEVEE